MEKELGLRKAFLKLASEANGGTVSSRNGHGTKIYEAVAVACNASFAGIRTFPDSERAVACIDDGSPF